MAPPALIGDQGVGSQIARGSHSKIPVNNKNRIKFSFHILRIPDTVIFEVVVMYLPNKDGFQSQIKYVGPEPTYPRATLYLFPLISPTIHEVSADRSANRPLNPTPNFLL